MNSEKEIASGNRVGEWMHRYLTQDELDWLTDSDFWFKISPEEEVQIMEMFTAASVRCGVPLPD
jgi:hypothetical protein